MAMTVATKAMTTFESENDGNRNDDVVIDDDRKDGANRQRLKHGSQNKKQ